MGNAARHFVIIGTPGDRRVTLFQEALKGLDLPPASVIAYADLLENRVDLDAAIPRDAIVRIESPGKDWAVNRALALRGKEFSNIRLTKFNFPSLEAAGEYIPSWAWYKGFCVCLDQLECLASRPDLMWMQDRADIRMMFDKWECHKRFDAINLPVPLSKRESYYTGHYFLKSRYGSSGTGMAAFQYHSRHRLEIRLYTTLALHEDKLINTRNIRKVVSHDDAFYDSAVGLWQEYEQGNTHGEMWIPKATIPGGAFDLRIVMIAGRMRHIVVRVSQSPITNLHLLNKRGDFEEVRRRISDAAWHRIEETCERVAALFPNSLSMGIDLLITATWNKHYVLEVNAFGDLLPNVLHEGEDTYTAEIREILKKS
jgi:hypothetical protein